MSVPLVNNFRVVEYDDVRVVQALLGDDEVVLEFGVGTAGWETLMEVVVGSSYPSQDGGDES